MELYAQAVIGGEAVGYRDLQGSGEALCPVGAGVVKAHGDGVSVSLYAALPGVDVRKPAEPAVQGMVREEIF